jgi:hypothetical protein
VLPRTVEVTPDLVAFSKRHEEITLELNVSTSMADLTKREADVAIRLSNDPPGHLVGRRLLKYAKAIYASESYLVRHDPADGSTTLNWIGWNDPVSDPQWIHESPYPDAPARNRIASSMIQFEAAKAGMGLSMLLLHGRSGTGPPAITAGRADTRPRHLDLDARGPPPHRTRAPFSRFHGRRDYRQARSPGGAVSARWGGVCLKMALDE